MTSNPMVCLTKSFGPTSGALMLRVYSLRNKLRLGCSKRWRRCLLLQPAVSGIVKDCIGILKAIEVLSSIFYILI
ncbi:hypothetical protein IHE45_04G034800 [Dioscorea alata]|uniref:Uncharacterized protein n=1 Tax=Dioscorea alata TaxID=55571 RepID=A0ACB7WC32_DIOAL|nr:hypothetical protein IHE45_04G034800 [Dioscorea alata]